MGQTASILTADRERQIICNYAKVTFIIYGPRWGENNFSVG